MERMHGKLSLGSVMLIVVALFWGTSATAGIVVEDYNAKLKGLQGAITKIEGNKITLKDQAGQLHTIRVRPESTDKDHKLVGFQIGDKVIIEGGRMNRISGDPIPLPRQAVTPEPVQRPGALPNPIQQPRQR